MSEKHHSCLTDTPKSINPSTLRSLRNPIHAPNPGGLPARLLSAARLRR
jgi:hypothetical protein